jgi:hypothetical protein
MMMKDFEELEETVNKTTVINIRFYHVPYVNVMGRSRFRNPFKITKTRTRGQVIRDFIVYFKRSKSLQRRVREELIGHKLGCCCHPKPCHADVYAKYCNGYTWKQIDEWAKHILL